MLKRASNVLLKFNKVAERNLLKQPTLALALRTPVKCPNFSSFNRFNNRVMSLNSFPKRGFASLPDNVKLAMPALSPTMEQGNIVKWNYKVGDKVDVGDQICEVETDKATLGFEVQDPGYIAAILVQDGAKGIKVGTPICILVDEEANVKAFANYKEEGSSEGATEEQPKEQSKEKPKQEKEQGKQQKQEGSVAEEKAQSNKKSVGKKTAAKKPQTQHDLPHHSKVAMPALSPTMETGKITQWTKKEGDKIDAGDVIANVETDKATIDFVYQDDGYLARILAPEGDGAIKVGDIVAIVVDEQSEVAAFKNYSGESEGQEQQTEEDQSEEAETEEAEESHEDKGKETKKPQEGKKQEASQTKQRPSGERVIASPYAKKIAGEQNVDLSQVEGSGPNGRILKHNVDEFVQKGGAKAKEAAPAKQTTEAKEAKPSKEAASETKAKPQPKAQEAPKAVEGQNPYTDIPLTSVREIIAKRLLQSKTTVPHYYLETEIVMDEIIKIRNQLNENNKVKISFNDIFIKAAAMACIEVPEVNSQWQGTFIRKFKNADVSVAVDTGSGLITPIVFAANTKGLNEISTNTKELIEKAKKNSLKPQEFQGGTFSISNLGMFGITNFAAVINPPQSAILAVGKTDKKVVAAGDGQFKTANVMNVTLSCDHRVVDGAVGARWLEKFKSCLEKPLTMLL